MQRKSHEPAFLQRVKGQEFDASKWRTAIFDGCAKITKHPQIQMSGVPRRCNMTHHTHQILRAAAAGAAEQVSAADHAPHKNHARHRAVVFVMVEKPEPP